ncbi:MAG: hypothetical protein CMM00_07050 [Rhodopirellula sp.]|nr:hypothetical protein [Rhodopirellula sp.]
MPRKATKNAVLTGFMSLRDGHDGHPVQMTFTGGWMQNETRKFPSRIRGRFQHPRSQLRAAL